MCLVVSVAGFHLSPNIMNVLEGIFGSLNLHKIERKMHVKINHYDSAVGPSRGQYHVT